MQNSTKNRIGLLSIILLVSINLLIGFRTADSYETKYKKDRFQYLHYQQNALFLDLESAEVKYIMLQSKTVWKKTLISSITKGFIYIGVYSLFLIIYLWTTRRKQNCKPSLTKNI